MWFSEDNIRSDFKQNKKVMLDHDNFQPEICYTNSFIVLFSGRKFIDRRKLKISAWLNWKHVNSLRTKFYPIFWFDWYYVFFPQTPWDQNLYSLNFHTTVTRNFILYFSMNSAGHLSFISICSRTIRVR